MTAAVGNGLGVVADDVNGDGRMDVFVANDGTPNHLWINLGGRRFEESALMGGVAIDQDGAPKAGMGVHAADVDDDGDNDLIVMNLDTESDSFFRNEGRFFVDDDHDASGFAWSAAGSRDSAWPCSTSTTTAGSTCMRPTAASACRPRRSGRTPMPSPTCCSAGVAGGGFEEVTAARRHRRAARRHQPRRGFR